MTQKPLISIVIPARNEEVVILSTLSELKRSVKTAYEIVVVNDLSTDHTKEVVNSYSKKNKRVRLVNNKKMNSGFSNALRHGFTESRGKYIVPVMADLCDDATTIDKMYKRMQSGYDLICGSRYIRGGKKLGGPQFQGFFSQVFNYILYHIIGIPTMDASNAFKMYRREILSKIKFDKKSGVEVSAQLVLEAFFQGAKISDIPTVWKGRTSGKSKFKLLERSPRYVKILVWAIIKSVSKNLLVAT